MSRAAISPNQLSRTTLTAAIIAAIVFLAGMVNIYSAWVGIEHSRVVMLSSLLPLKVSHCSRTLTVLAGMLLIMLSWSLFRRKRRAWIAAVALLSISLALHMLKGLDYEEAIFTALVLGALLGARGEFVVRSDPRSFFSAGMVCAMAVLGSLLYGILGFALLQMHFKPSYTISRGLQSTVSLLTSVGDPSLQPRTVMSMPRRRHVTGRRPLSAPIRTQHPDRDAVWFSDSLVAIAFISAFSIAAALLRPVARSLHVLDYEREEVRRLLVEHGGAPLAYWSLLPGLSYLFTPSRRAALAYHVEDNVALVLGDPLGDPAEIPALIATYDSLCLLNDWHPAWYQITERWRPVLRTHGWSGVKIGEDALIDLSTLNFTGKAWQDVRTALNRLPREGYRAEWYDMVTDPAGWIPALEAISHAWLSNMHAEERGFSLGTWTTALRFASEQRVLVLVDPQEQPVAFLSFAPVYGTPGGWALDLMRRTQTVPPGSMEFLLATALQSFQQEGATVCSLGLSALSDVTPIEAENTELLERVRALVYEHFNRLYNFKGLHQFKDKFQPNWEARYLVYPSLPLLPRILLALIRAHTVPTRPRPPQMPPPVTDVAEAPAAIDVVVNER